MVSEELETSRADFEAGPSARLRPTAPRAFNIGLLLLGVPASIVAILYAAGVVSSALFVAFIVVQGLGTMALLAVLASGSGVVARNYLREGALVLTSVATFGVAAAVVPSRASQTFFAVAAQVIPVLLLTLAVELRAFRVPWPLTLKEGDGLRLGPVDLADFMRTVVLLVALLFLAIGEFEALDALAKPHPERLYAKNVFIAIAVGVVLVCFFALAGPMPEEDRRRSRPPRRRPDT